MSSASHQNSKERLITRRGFVKWLGTTTVSMAALSTGGVAYAWNFEPKYLTTEEVTISLPRLPSTFEGLRIAQLSDLHLGPYVDAEIIKNAIDAANAAKPDLVVITGDLVAVSWQFMDPCLKLLESVTAPLGVYVVFGNHDFNVGNMNHTIAAVKRSGLTLLRNQSVPLSRGGSSIHIVGVDDWSYGQSDINGALHKVPGDACKIVLLHEPDVVDVIASKGIDLQLSGHSHGGQVRIPGLGPLMLPRFGKKYPMGLAKVSQSTQVYTSRGIGVTPPAFRFNCPPEVTLIQLTSRPV